MTRAQNRPTESEMVEAYEAWDPETSTVEEFARSQRISKQGLYLILRKRGIPTKREQAAMERRRAERPPTLGEMTKDVDALLDRIADGVLKSILEENAELKARLGLVGPAADLKDIEAAIHRVAVTLRNLESYIKDDLKDMDWRLADTIRRVDELEGNKTRGPGE